MCVPQCFSHKYGLCVSSVLYKLTYVGFPKGRNEDGFLHTEKD